jgi:hypothetical protein
VTNLTGTASININGTVGATTASTGAFTTLSASGLLSANAGLSVTGTTQGSGLFKIGTGTFTTAVNTTGVQFDTSTTNSGIEWVASSSGSGYGHRITDIDSGAGYAAWKLQGRTNSGTFSTVLQVDGTTGLAVTGLVSGTYLFQGSAAQQGLNAGFSGVAGNGFSMRDTTNSRTYFFTTETSTGLQINAGANPISLIASSVAVTGALSATGTISTSAGNITALNGILQVGSGSKQLYLRTLTGVNRIDSYDNPITATQPLTINSSIMRMAIADTDRAVLDSTGLAVTGNITSTTASTLCSGGGILTVGSNTSAATGIIINSLATTGNMPYINFKAAGTQYGLVALTGALLGTTATDMGIFAETGKTINLWANGQATIGAQVNSTGLAVTGALSATTAGRFGTTSAIIHVTESLSALASSGVTVGFASDAAASWPLSLWHKGTGTKDLAVFYSNDGGSFGLRGKIQTDGTGVSLISSSDERLKTNFRPITNSGVIIDALAPSLFDWLSGQKDTYGFGAQSTYQVFPQAVAKGDDNLTEITDQWGMDVSKLVPILVAELQSLRQRVAALENS